MKRKIWDLLVDVIEVVAIITLFLLLGYTPYPGGILC